MPNPTTSMAACDADNGLTYWNDASLAYDANGNMTSDGTNTYTSNTRNRLASIAGNTTASFEYGPFGRRLQKTVNGSTTDFLYDASSAPRMALRGGVNPVQELSGATVDANMLDGLGVDEYFQRADLSRCLHGYGAVRIGRIGLLGTWDYLDDALGSTIALADTTGTLQTQYTYSPFDSTTTQGQASSNSFQFTGRENDGDGLYYYRARYYDPMLSRFISQDPLGFVGGVNIYAYASSAPSGLVDPYGLYPWQLMQKLSNFTNGAANALTLGLVNAINHAAGDSQFVNKCSGWYKAGTGVGIGLSTAMGGAQGAEAAGANAGEEGYEFSHWIPNRMGGPRSTFNGNYVSEELHYLTDPFRYPSGWQEFGPKLPAAMQQVGRIPWVYTGAAAGAAFGGASAMASRGCGCH